MSWYDSERRILPWREDPTPYHVWVSEIMLQQTRVDTVIEYYQRFLRELPDVKALAEAEEERLLKLWQGLGYYSRIRNMHKGAIQVMEEYGGEIPGTPKELQKLSGIGEYVAAAISSIAFAYPIPSVDGNLLRVYARMTGYEESIRTTAARKVATAYYEEILDRTRPGDMNQALMDLGAGICLPGGAPLCDTCPAADFCAAREQGRQRELPVRAPKKEYRLEEKTVFLLLGPEGTALRQRPDTGLLAGLWEYPHVPGRLTEEQAARQLRQWGLTPRAWLRQMDARHIFTHIRWEMTGYLVQVEGRGPEDWLWADGTIRARLAVPSAFEKFTRALPAEGE